MDVIKARAFLRAVKNKSLSKTAEELDYTPSALSHMADSMEEELGVKLFNRTPKGVFLTENGKILYPLLKELVDAEDTLLKKAENLRGDSNFNLRIGTYSSIALNLLPSLIKEFKKKHPEIKVSIKVENNLRGYLKENKADVIISDTEASENEAVIPIALDPFVAVVPADYFPNKTSVKIEELYDFPLIYTKEKQLQAFVDYSKFKELIQFDSVDDLTVLSMVKEKIGVAILPALVLKRRVKGIKALKTEELVNRELKFIHLKDVKTASVKKFIKFASDYIKIGRI